MDVASFLRYDNVEVVHAKCVARAVIYPRGILWLMYIWTRDHSKDRQGLVSFSIQFAANRKVENLTETKVYCIVPI